MVHQCLAKLAKSHIKFVNDLLLARNHNRAKRSKHIFRKDKGLPHDLQPIPGVQARVVQPYHRVRIGRHVEDDRVDVTTNSLHSVGRTNVINDLSPLVDRREVFGRNPPVRKNEVAMPSSRYMMGRVGSRR